VKGSRHARCCQSVDPAGSLRVFASSCDSKPCLPCAEPEMHAARISAREECGLRDADAEVHARLLRPRVGTKPAATRLLADRELPTSLREDLGHPGLPGSATEAQDAPMPVPVTTAVPAQGHQHRQSRDRPCEPPRVDLRSLRVPSGSSMLPNNPKPSLHPVRRVPSIGAGLASKTRTVTKADLPVRMVARADRKKRDLGPCRFVRVGGESLLDANTLRTTSGRFGR
jgi:hypothetical protein